MSKEEKTLKNKRLWVAAAAAVVIILLLLIAALIIRNNKRSAQEKDIASLLSGYLTSQEANTELDFLSGLSEEDTEKIIMAMVRTLNSFSENGDINAMNKDEMLSTIQTALSNLGLDLNEQQIRLLSERLLEHYLENASETYKSTKEINNTIQTMEDAMSNQMTENLTSISEYLTRLDETVLHNQEQLALISQTQSENLHQVYQYVSELDQDVVEVKNILNNFEERYAADVAANNVSFTNISSKLEETKKLIDSTKNQVITVLDELENSNKNRHQETANKIAEVKNSVSSLDSHLTDVYNDLDKTISDFEKNMEEILSENQQTMLSELTSAKDFLKSAMDENMSTINTLASNLSSMIEENFDETQELIRTDVENLQAKMDSIHTQIITTQSEITSLLNTMEENDKLRQDELLSNIADVNASIQKVNESLLQINSDMDAAHAELKDLMVKLQESENANHAELLSVLGTMEQEMADQAGDNMSQIMDSFGALTSFFTSETEKLQNLVNSLGENVSSQLTDLESEIGSQFSTQQTWTESQLEMLKQVINSNHTDITNLFSSDTEELKTYLDSLHADLQTDLQSVFTSVSDGKGLLASALLTKGVSCAEDATFKEIYDAIMAIKQELLIGVEQLPGEISYDYHYHTDADGNTPHTDTAALSGGCYTAPVYHQHSSACYGSAKCGGSVSWKTSSTHWKCSSDLTCDAHGCYWEDPNEMYPSGCWHCYCPEETYSVCNSCGARSSGSPCGATTTKLVCGKSGSTIESYKTACGLSDGQIIGAHIIYNANTVSEAAVMMLAAPAPDPIVEPSPVNTYTYPELDLPEGAVIDRGNIENSVPETSAEPESSEATPAEPESSGSTESESETITESTEEPATEAAESESAAKSEAESESFESTPVEPDSSSDSQNTESTESTDTTDAVNTETEAEIIPEESAPASDISTEITLSGNAA